MLLLKCSAKVLPFKCKALYSWGYIFYDSHLSLKVGEASVLSSPEMKKVLTSVRYAPFIKRVYERESRRSLLMFSARRVGHDNFMLYPSGFEET